ncbi:MAG: hypothetical protein EBQ94_02000 [Flavobacteriales bacterium]|nr:hypothetical protein [Flavobacteriales bacterium]NCA21583.1 hypothetical protein [Crocinitomicaceae bacterium]
MNDLKINESLTNFDFVEKTMAQISKDFNRSGIDFEFQLQSNLPLKEQVVSEIRHAIVKLSSTELQQFIYTIDLNENDFLKAVTINDDLLTLSERILQREALKVFIKINYQG